MKDSTVRSVRKVGAAAIIAGLLLLISCVVAYRAGYPVCPARTSIGIFALLAGVAALFPRYWENQFFASLETAAKDQEEADEELGEGESGRTGECFYLFTRPPGRPFLLE
jgi:hypothetical protein